MTTKQPSHAKALTPRDFPIGTRVRVPLGARTHEATVIEHRRDRVRVAIHIAGGTEAVQSSYRPDELQLIA